MCRLFSEHGGVKRCLSPFSQSAAATADGIVGLTGWHPFANAGLYDPSNPTRQWSQFLGGVGRDLISSGGAVAVRIASTVEKIINVSRWGRKGLQVGDWVMQGRVSRSTFIRSFKCDPKPTNIRVPFRDWKTARQDFRILRSRCIGPRVGKNLREFSDNEFMILKIMKILLLSIGVLFFTGCAVANLSVLIKWLFQNKHGSMIPFIGGLVGCIVLFVVSWESFKFYWWIPLMLDASYGMCAFGIMRALFKLK